MRIGKVISFLITFALLAPINAFAIGGDGAQCAPGVGSWPMCSLDPISFASSVTNNATIAGGAYSEPIELTQPNTYYTLSSGIVAAGTAIKVRASNVIVDLNGHTILYNESKPGEGVVVSEYNLNNIAVRNGSIIQGAAKSEGDEYGNFNNPVGVCHYDNLNCRSVPGFEVANIYSEYGGRDVGGVQTSGNNAIISNVVTKDTYAFGTLKNRHAGVNAVQVGEDSTVRNVTVLSARQRGISIGSGSYAYDNKVEINSIAVNSYGFFAYSQQNVTIRDNTVNATGSHPIGIGVVSDGSNNATIFGNDIYAKTTAIDSEYSAAYTSNPSEIITGNFAVGFRTTWGANNINFYGNRIVVESDSNYVGTYAPTNETAHINGGARGLMIGTNANESADFHDNNITAIDKDGTGNAYAVSIVLNYSDYVFVRNNTIRSNIVNVAISDEYGASSGYPLVYNNTIEKIGDYAAYSTFENRFNGYMTSTARIVDNVFTGGADANSYRVNDNPNSPVSWYFGTKSGDDYLYSTHINDANNTLSESITETLDPAITLPYANPGDIPPDPSTVCSASNPGPCAEAECSTLGLYWYDGQCNPTPEFLCALDNLAACTEAQCSVLGKRWVDGVCTSQAAETDCPECPECPPSGGRLLMIGRKLLSLP